MKARWVASKAGVNVMSAPDVLASKRCLTRASRVPARSRREDRGGGKGAWRTRRGVSLKVSSILLLGIWDNPNLAHFLPRFRNGLNHTTTQRATRPPV